MRVTRGICVGKKLCTINSHSSYPLCFKSMTLKEAIKSSLIILKQVMEEKLNATNIEVLFCFIDFLFRYHSSHC